MKKIILIDDNPNDLLLIGEDLAEAGYEIFDFDDANKAIKEINNLKPDVVVTDTIMSGMEGIETLRHIINTHDGLPVIVMSGERHYVDMMEDLGAYASVEKSADSNQLIEVLNRLFADRLSG